jgi:hypothetical protein
VYPACPSAIAKYANTEGSLPMTTFASLAAMLLLLATPCYAGCLGGTIIGGAVSHMAVHGVLEAAGGCVIDAHYDRERHDHDDHRHYDHRHYDHHYYRHDQYRDGHYDYR